MKNKNVVINNRVVLGLTQHFQHLPLSFINDLRGRFQIKFGMTPLFNNGGFTLIELLVVVLIIGILAAVALPQYETAVTKSRLTQALTMLKSIRDAQQAFVLANGYYAPTLEELDIDLSGCTLDVESSVQSNTVTDNFYSCPNDIKFLIHTSPNLIDLNTTYAFLFASNENKSLAIEYQINNTQRLCQSNFSAGKKACQSFGGTEYTTKANGNIIVYQLP